MKPLERILTKFLRLQSKKWHVAYKAYGSNSMPFLCYTNISRLRRIVSREISLLRRVQHAGSAVAGRIKHDKLRELVLLLVKLCNPLEDILGREKWLLAQVKLSELRKDKGLADEQGKIFYKMFNRELEMSRMFTNTIVHHKEALSQIKGYSAERKKLENAKKLLFLAQDAFKNLMMAQTFKEATKANAELMELLGMLQETEIYSYIRSDVDFIKRKAKDIMSNPRENKMAYVFTGIYIVAPFTFEATALLLTLKYTTKYAISKGKKIGNLMRRKKASA